MDLLDLLLIAVCIGFAVSGYRQGFLIGVLSFAGFLGGGVLGAKYAPALHQAISGPDAESSPLFGLLVVFVAATIGQLAATALGITVRRRITWDPARRADAMGGAVVRGVSRLLLAGVVGRALAPSADQTGGPPGGGF